MLEIENVNVYGWEAAIRGMRNPKNSWDKSDSHYVCDNTDNSATFHVGDKDYELMMKLAKAGAEHAKYLRMINVTMDITAPLYWWKEFDTYKVGTVANSCSTMHTLHTKEFTLDDFSHEHLETVSLESPEVITADSRAILEFIIKFLNFFREMYNKTKDKKYWWQMIQLLPSSFNQKRTVQLNYAVLSAMYHQRKNHKLDEWHTFCKFIETELYKSKLITKEEL